MAERRTSRLTKLLRIAGRREQQAAVDHQRSQVELDQATERAQAANAAAQLAPPGGEVVDMQRHAQLAELRGRGALDREGERREMLADEIAAREELMSAMRRRRSYERLDERHAMQNATLATQAAQRALDEIGRRGVKGGQP